MHMEGLTTHTLLSTYPYAQASVLSWMTQGSPTAMEYRAGIDAINYMFDDLRVSKPSRRRARAFYRKSSQGLHKRVNYGEVRVPQERNLSPTFSTRPTYTPPMPPTGQARMWCMSSRMVRLSLPDSLRRVPPLLPIQTLVPHVFTAGRWDPRQ